MDLLNDGMSAVSSVMTFIESSTIFQVLIGVALSGVALSIVLGLFFRR